MLLNSVVEAVIRYCAGTVGPQRCGRAGTTCSSQRSPGRSARLAGEAGRQGRRRGRPGRRDRAVPSQPSPKPFGEAGKAGRQLTAWKTGTISTMVQLEAEAAAPERRRLPGSEFSAVVAAVTSAFGDPTRRQVYLFVRDAGTGATASQVAQHFSLHPNVARHHLDKLAAGGYLEVFSSRAQVSGAGRPSKFYRASGPAPVLETTRPGEELLLSLLGGALALLPQEEAEKMAEQVGFAYGSKLASSMVIGEGQRSFRSALRAVADALTAHGFAAHAEARGQSLALVKEACPFFDAALQHPVICAVDRGMVKGMLNALYGRSTGPAESSSRAMGDETCSTCLPAGV